MKASWSQFIIHDISAKIVIIWSIVGEMWADSKYSSSKKLVVKLTLGMMYTNVCCWEADGIVGGQFFYKQWSNLPAFAFCALLAGSGEPPRWAESNLFIPFPNLDLSLREKVGIICSSKTFISVRMGPQIAANLDGERK